ncbi:MAG TPA: EAL domain-containing protein [Methylophilus sp.]|nr:EAL domain-containing protein [Methylophilus sp.]HQQ32625.1 EAL domain-containing protein [Methylophilus sp.]
MINVTNTPSMLDSLKKASTYHATLNPNTSEMVPHESHASLPVPVQDKHELSTSAAYTDAKLMFVSSDAVNYEIMQAYLKQFGYTSIIPVYDLDVVYDLVHIERPDVILLDNMSISESEFGILEKIQNNKKVRQVPIVILTAHAELEAKLRALELGVVEVLIKPVHSDELALRLRNILSVKTYQNHLANYDPLTHLPNRESYIGRLDWALKYAKRYGSTGAVLQLNLNRFKNINDALGPTAGDRLLKMVADRLQDTLRKSDLIARIQEESSETTLSRIGGDEFSVLLPVIAHPEDAAVAAQRIQKQLESPFQIGDREVYVSCHIGISVFPNDGTAKDAIMHAAGASLHQAKLEGKNGYKFYSGKLNEKAVHRLAMENEMHKALAENQFEVHYQPKIDFNTGNVIGAEALIRWHHPQNGPISPAEFIPIAEETGLILKIGDWIIREVCRQISEWKATGLTPPRIAINVSSLQFRQPRFLEQLQSILESTQVESRFLGIELTESTLMGNTIEVASLFSQLRGMGIKIAIDDFGTGYSSLSHLKKLPLDELKIDRSFVIGIGKEKDTEAIIMAIVSMAHNLGLSVIAEGVETKEHVKFLAGIGCDGYQGFLFSKPVAAPEFYDILSSVNTNA